MSLGLLRRDYAQQQRIPHRIPSKQMHIERLTL